MIYMYAALSLAIGVVSKFVSPVWTVCVSVLVIAGAIVIGTWPWIDVNRDGVQGTLARLAAGTFWLLIPTGFVYALAFAVGRVSVTAFQSRRE